MFIGSILVLSSGIIFGIIPLITVSLFADGLNTATVSFFRYLFLMITIVMISIVKGNSLKLERDKIFKIITHLGIMTAITSLLLVGSYNYISTGAATTIHFLYPVAVILICCFYYREKLSKQIIIAVILVVVGLLGFMESVQLSGVIGIVMAFLSAVTYALYILQLERTKLNRLNPLTLSFYIALTSIAVLYFSSFFIGKITFSFSFRDLLLFILLGILTMMAQIFFQLGSRYLGSKLSALLSLSEPMTSMVVGVIILNERISVLKIVGCVLILGAILVATYRNNN